MSPGLASPRVSEEAEVYALLKYPDQVIRSVLIVLCAGVTSCSSDSSAFTVESAGASSPESGQTVGVDHVGLPPVEKDADASALESAGKTQESQPSATDSLSEEPVGSPEVSDTERVAGEGLPVGEVPVVASTQQVGDLSDQGGVAAPTSADEDAEIDAISNETEAAAEWPDEALIDLASTWQEAEESAQMDVTRTLEPVDLDSFEPYDLSVEEKECLGAAPYVGNSVSTIAATSQGDVKIFNGEVMYLVSSGSPEYDLQNLDLSGLKVICIDMRGSPSLRLRVAHSLDHLIYFAKGSPSVEVLFAHQASVDKVSVQGSGDPSLVLKGAGLKCDGMKVSEDLNWECSI